MGSNGRRLNGCSWNGKGRKEKGRRQEWTAGGKGKVTGGRRKGMGGGSDEMKDGRRTEGLGGEIRGEQMRKRGGSRNRRSMKEDVPRELEMGSKRRKGFERE
jgi:hypothetical protein